MAGRTRALTILGEDMDLLLRMAGKFTLREYADECGVSYKYLLQLRTSTSRRPGKLYVDLLNPFTRLGIVDLAEAHRLSLRHRNRPLSLTECRTLFPEVVEQQLVESIRGAVDASDPGRLKVNVDARHATDESKVNVRPIAETQIYRRVFVGRQRELDKLRRAFDAAAAGEGALVMVSGEPGIGKTAICGQLAAYVRSLGGISLTGRCYEAGSLSLPYLAFIEALRSHVLTCDASDLAREVGAGAADVARVIPEIAERLGVTVRAPGDAVEEKFRLLQGVADFLGKMAISQPLLLVLEDLHSADEGTLEMLQHVARNLGSRRVLLVGTYRDVEVDRAHPLSASLAELRRLPEFGQVILRGLAAEEVKGILSGMLGDDTPSPLANVVHDVTEGNPLFVEEVARFLVEESLATSDGGLKHLAQDPGFEMKIPVGLRDVVGKRLSRMSERCNQVLSMAAVIGRDFRLDVLEKIAEMPEDDIFEAIQEATKAAVLEEYAEIGVVNYRFAHAFFRQMLYEEMIAPRRIRLHLQAGRALEEAYSAVIEEHAAELAEHFSHSSDSADLKKAVFYGELAARRARDVYAYGEAVRLLEQAIKVQEIFGPRDQGKICDLRLDLCDALLAIPDAERVARTEGPAALAVAESLGDDVRAVRACTQTGIAGVVQGLTASPWFAEWIARADRYAGTNTVERPFIDFMAGEHRLAQGDRRGAKELLRQSLELARQLDDRNTFQLAAARLCYLTTPRSDEIGQLSGELAASLESGVNPLSVGLVSIFAVGVFLNAGQRERAEQLCGRLRTIAELTGRPLLKAQSAGIDATLALMDGRFARVLELLTIRRVVSEEFGIAGLARSVHEFRCRILLGESVKDYDVARPPSANFAILAPWCQQQAYVGRQDEVVSALDELVVDRPGFGTNDDLTPASTDVLFLEASVLVKHKGAARMLSERFKGSTVCTGGNFALTCVARHLGVAAVLLGRYDEARQHYQEAIRVCTEMRFRPELALTRLQLAELLLDQYPDEKYDAVEHIDFAIKEFREMKMRPSLERALRRRDILKA